MKRLRTVGLVATLLAVGVLAGSLALGLGRGGGPESAVAAGVRQQAGTGVRVEVLNASAAPGLARLATHSLRKAGFDVVYFGNAAGERPDSSVVIDRVGEPERARAVAVALGIEAVRSAPDSTRYLDVSVVLGREWRPREVPLPLAPAERATP